jgi:hypothetical protein
MALTDQDLANLKKRCIDAMGAGSFVAHSNEDLLQLIAEVEKHRKAACCQEAEVAPVQVASKPMVVKGELSVETASAPEAASSEKVEEKVEVKRGRGAGKKVDKDEG